jgi:hypothetical protein
MDHDMRRWGDVVAFANGRLEASLYELVVVEVAIEEDLESSFVVYTLDCSDAWTGVRTFIQACHVTRGGQIPLADAVSEGLIAAAP